MIYALLHDDEVYVGRTRMTLKQRIKAHRGSRVRHVNRAWIHAGDFVPVSLSASETSSDETMWHQIFSELGMTVVSLSDSERSAAGLRARRSTASPDPAFKTVHDLTMHKMREAAGNTGGLATAKLRKRCSCGLESTVMGMGNHLRRQPHHKAELLPPR